MSFKEKTCKLITARRQKLAYSRLQIGTCHKPQQAYSKTQILICRSSLQGVQLPFRTEPHSRKRARFVIYTTPNRVSEATRHI
jgi:hypothetical protein